MKNSIDWFKRARYGMFYHFGLYSLLGGNENAVRSEHGKDEYRKLMNQFKAENFNADDWVDCAVSMGAKYIVPTAKHAEGFCLWDSKLTDLKSTNTPCGRDLIAELAAAAARKGVKFAFYFNLETWLNDGNDIWNRQGMAYIDFIEGQLEELLTSYGPVALVWFDHECPYDVPFERFEKIIKKIKSLQPDCLVNDRGYSHKTIPYLLGDFVTPERHVPEVAPDRNLVVECCDSMGVTSWGYCSDDTFWSSEELSRRVSKCASMGYNYLLNVEPAPDGKIRHECVDRAAALGEWIRRHEEGLSASSCKIEPHSNLDQKASIGVSSLSNETKALYIHLWEWPKSDEILIPAKGTPVSAELEDGTKLTIRTDDIGMVLGGLPAVAPASQGPWFIKLGFKEKPEALPPAITKKIELLPGQSAFLAPEKAEISFGTSVRGIKTVWVNYFTEGKVSLGNFHAKDEKVSWQVDVPEEGEYDVYMSLGSIKTQSDAGFELSSGISSLTGRSWLTDHYSKPERRYIGKLSLAAGENQIVLKVTDVPNGSFSDVHGIWLIPA